MSAPGSIRSSTDLFDSICGAVDRAAATGTVSMTWAAYRQDRPIAAVKRKSGTLHFTRELLHEGSRGLPRDLYVRVG